MIGVIRKNGAGKSTFLEILMTIKQYDAGTVILFDEDILSLSTNRMEPHRKKYFDKLSGGLKQIVSLAIAFLPEPKLPILDEPTTGLDPHSPVDWLHFSLSSNRIVHHPLHK